MIEFRNVTKKYDNDTILDDISFTVQDGEFVVFIGESGCGKTTTLRMINRLIKPNKGNIYIDGKDIADEDPVQLRRSIGYVIQQIGLFPNMTIAQNISVVPKLLKYPKEKCDKIVHELLEMVNLPYDEYAHKYPSELSGGQQQRIGVLRALAASPPIVLMDEPFGALDPITRASLQEDMKTLQKKLKKTIIFVTHDMDEALYLADRIVFMDGGEIVQMAEPDEMLANPANNLVKSFLGERVNNGHHFELKVKDIMRTKVVAVRKSRSVAECIKIMANRSIDSLIIKNEDETYLGMVAISDCLTAPKNESIESLVNKDCPIVCKEDDAKTCYNKLVESKQKYCVVLDEDKKTVGIVTWATVARAIAGAVWGGDE